MKGSSGPHENFNFYYIPDNFACFCLLSYNVEYKLLDLTNYVPR